MDHHHTLEPPNTLNNFYASFEAQFNVAAKKTIPPLQRPVRIKNSISSTTTLSTGTSQGHSTNHIPKFADDTTVVGFISKNEESEYRDKLQQLTAWCKDNNLYLIADKTKDFRIAQSDYSSLNINGSSIEIIKSTKTIGVHLAKNLTWSINTGSISKKAQQCIYFL
ncbi:uncharacterized protein LOC121182596, partial [Tachysurus ichikawai]